MCLMVVNCAHNVGRDGRPVAWVLRAAVNTQLLRPDEEF